MSSRLIPPKEGQIPHAIDECVNVFRAEFQVYPIHIGEALEQSRFLHHRLDANPPKLPSPRTAVPFDMTATMFPLAV